ncbi:MAG TPA: HAD family hydrolase [Euzebyales bacterium]
MRFGVVLDLDGTLVDSVYHHVLAWDAALSRHGHQVPLDRIHRAIGLGGSRLVTWLLGGQPDDVDALTDAHETLFLADAERLRPTVGAGALIDDLQRREVPTVIATSAQAAIREALLGVLGDPQLPATDADTVDDAKPSADLLIASSRQIEVEPAHAVLIGDSPWDVAAARRVGMQMIAVRTGGFADSALLARGPATIVGTPNDLVGTL